jgi:chromosome segregation ATPase
MTDSSDLVERLRKGRSANEWVSEELAREAAATIQRLEAERAEAYEKGRESAFEEIGNYYLMRKDCQDALAKAQAAITALQSERDRLREALAEIEKMGGAYEDAYQEVGRLRSIARAALAGKGSDLVERLRIHGSPINLEAAATIQRLEADNQAWKEAWEREHAHCNAYNEEITALQSECNELRPKLANALAQLDRSQSERDRLRKALEEIRLLDRFADPGEPWQYGLFASIARAALAGKD